MTKLENIDAVFDDFIDADFETGDPREDEYEQLAALPGASFQSVFGKAVYAHARERLSNAAGCYGYSERDREAYWPSALTHGLEKFAGHKLAADLDGTPTPENIETAQERSGHFLKAWSVMTGNDMKGGQMSAHQRLEAAPGVPQPFLDGARELRDTGVTKYTDKVLAYGSALAHGERDRTVASAKRVRIRSKGGEQR